MNPLSKKNLLAIACVLALSACGSSGSGNALSVQPNTPKPEAPKSQDPKPQPQDPAPQPQD
ncbi:MAG: transferrin-binding protein-like solute binding protein, partial [Eikenella sp.]|nr:transferrin-binding protein-like solute binding protein [Eikenella sp.]